MSIDRHLQEKIYRLETLKKYQAYYGANTPYQIIAEINQLEAELRRMLKADVTRPTKVASPARKKPKPARQPQPARPAPQPQPQLQAYRQASAKSKTASFGRLSGATTDIVAAMALVGGVVLIFGMIILVAYYQTKPAGNAALAQANQASDPALDLRPTFTPTRDPNAPAPEVVAVAVEDASADSFLPSPHKVPTDIPTPVPTLTPSPMPSPTSTPTSPPTNTPIPTRPPAPPPPTATPAPPTPTPAPTFPFMVAEQGNRMFQSTSYHVVTVYVAIVSEGNIPIGGLKVVGDHTPSGLHAESGLSDWNWSATNCLDCSYVKFGNVKFEPGTFMDGTWNIYVADEQGTRLSPVVPLTYSSDPAQWVWDFVIFKKTS